MRNNLIISAFALVMLVCTSACKKQYRQYKCACTPAEGNGEIVEYGLEAETIVEANTSCLDIEVKVNDNNPVAAFNCKLN